MKKIIAFCGVIGSGKDYAAKKYISDGYTQINFADSLKEIIFQTLKIKITDHKIYEMFKDNYWNPITKIFPSFNGRDILQLGNVARKLIYEDIWVDAWEKKITNKDKIVVSDVRYFNEAKKIVSLGGEIYFCNFKSTKYNSKTKFESEKMAQDLIEKDFKNGENITSYFIKKTIDEVI
jgi:hypothetical protein